MDQAREIRLPHGSWDGHSAARHLQRGRESDWLACEGDYRTKGSRDYRFGCYISAMSSDTKGPMAKEMEMLLTAAFSPLHLAVINDSGHHSGHSGDDGSGESHFTIEIESAAFAGVSRVMRQRMVNQALGDIPGQRVHALAIKASAPGG
jgi:BolA family transcriptional regulator, general stress-responsive regulator